MKTLNFNYDTIVIGAGLGGLTAAAKLSKAGRKVLLIEQHYLSGGCATNFKRKAFIMETSLHQLDGLDPEDLKVKAFKDLDVFDQVNFVKIPHLYKIIGSDYSLSLPADIQEAIEVLSAQFPHEKKALQKYYQTLSDIRSELKRMPKNKLSQLLLFPLFPVLFPYLCTLSSKPLEALARFNPLYWIFNAQFTRLEEKNVGDFVDRLFQDEELKKILLGNYVYYADDPYKLSLYYFAVAQVGYHKGSYYIQGGSYQLSKHLENCIKKNGGEVLLNHLVNRILVEKGTVVGVSYQKTQNKTATKYHAYAKNIIANSAIPNLVNMLPEREGTALAKNIQALSIGMSLIPIRAGFKRPLKEINDAYEIYFLEHFDRSQTIKTYKENLYADFEKAIFSLVDYSQIDSALAPEGKSVASINFIAKFEDWSKLSPEAYQRKKARLKAIVIQRLEQHLPGFKERLEYITIGTPTTIADYTLNPRGSVYGFTQSYEQSGLNRITNKSIIPNLYYASAWTFPGGGFTGAILSGWMTAQAILKKPAQKKLSPLANPDPSPVKLLKKRRIARNTLELELERPRDFDFKAGQYTILQNNAPRSPKHDLYYRPFSISSSPHYPNLKFSMRISDSGFKQSCLLAEEGDSFSLFGPRGNFTLEDTPTDKPLVFLIAGIGITPVRSILYDLEAKQSKKTITLIYSNHSEETAAYLAELKEIKLRNFTLISAISEKIIVTEDYLLKHLNDLQANTYYIIGTSGFIEAMEGILKKHQVDEVHIDDFG